MIGLGLGSCQAELAVASPRQPRRRAILSIRGSFDQTNSIDFRNLGSDRLVASGT